MVQKNLIKILISPGARTQGLSYCLGAFFDNTFVCILALSDSLQGLVAALLQLIYIYTKVQSSLNPSQQHFYILFNI